jgi:hypothetical protein
MGKRWTKRRVADLQSTVESAHANTSFASSILAAIWNEWEPRKGVTAEERERVAELLADAKIQIDMALEEVERG